MAVSAGEMSTRIIVEAPHSEEDGKGGEIDVWKNVFGKNVSGEDVTIPAKWRRKMTRFDSTVDNKADDRVIASETAKVHVRYCSGITSVCRIRRIGDEFGYWYIIGTPERSDNRGWLEFTVERRAAAL